MTANRDLKKIIRQRMASTGELYTVAREHVLRERERVMNDRAAKRDEEKDADKKAGS